MTTCYVITAPSPGELKQLAELYREAGWWKDAPANLDQVARIVAGSHCFVVARSSERIIGMGRAISDRVSDAYIQDVTVAESQRGRGVGREIVSAILARLKADGMSWIGLIAERGTRGLYEPVGFEVMPDSVPMLLGAE